MADSTIPAAIAALVAMFTAALPAVQVFDSDITADVQKEYVGVAFPDSADPAGNPGVTFTQGWAALGAGRKFEEYDIRCQLSSWSGDGTIAARRTRAFAMFAACQTALRADSLLAGALPTGAATTGPGQLIDADTQYGPTCTLAFTVEVRNVRI
jgi:hypothetical protein